MSARSAGRRAFSLFTAVLCVLCLWTAYANVFSDDTALRARAGDLARQKAGCGDKCKLVQMQGTRGMITEEINYTFDGLGMFVVTCRRAYVSFGEYACEAAKP
jgi:hypothetical protein